MKVKHLLFVLTLCVGALASDVTVPIVDKSATGSPVSSTGTASVSTTPLPNGGFNLNYSLDWTVKNVSQKAIVAVVATSTVTFADGSQSVNNARSEYFFNPTLVGPGAELYLSADGITDAMVRAAVPAGPPAVTVVVNWVQFADGTTYGDNSAATSLLQSRQAMWAGFQALKAAYDAGGITALQQKLSQPILTSDPIATSYVAHLQDIQQAQGTQAALTALLGHLQAADQHASALGTTATAATAK